jgi:outer membrane protein OmpA-like peptidoglycan-associated protein
MKICKEIPFTLLVSLLCFSSCAKKVDPNSELIRNSNANEEPASADEFNQGTDDEFSIAGNTLLGSNDDLLAPRSNELDAFSDPLNTIRPFEPVYFGFDQYNINATEREKLAEIADFLKTNPNGTPAYNKSLGDRRATTVKSYLSELGADQSRIDTVSIGDESAIPNADGAQAKLDRRAAFVVTKGS